MRKDIGVIIGRFQTPNLHYGHRFLIDYALRRHDVVLVVIGNSPLPLTKRNPMDYETRKQMIASAYPNIVISMLEDTASDVVWSNNLDKLVNSLFPGKNAVLYGSRDCFAAHYFGKHKCVVLKPPQKIEDLSATTIRESVEVTDSPDFRSGVIYASMSPFPTSYQVVDVAVIDEVSQKVLLGQKAVDEGKYRFIGGFVDVTDESLEQAAKREVFEETSAIETDEYQYLGSTRVDDWRYRGSEHKIMSAFFRSKYIFGRAKASDDLERLEWFPLSEVEGLVIVEHLPMAKMLLKSLEKK